MKILLGQGDRIASRALSELDGKTTLQVANMPNLDAWAI